MSKAKRLEKRFVEDVLSMNEGQLLQQQDSFPLTANKVETFDVRIVTGRGDVMGYLMYFIGEANDSQMTSYTFLVNGKEIQADMPALAYTIDHPAALPFESFTPGTGRMAKQAYWIPAAARISVRVTTGAIGVTNNIFVNRFFTEKFLPRDYPFNLVQNFTEIYNAGGASAKRFNIPADRGRVVGLSIFTNSDPALMDDASGGLIVAINGVIIISNVSASQFIRTQNMIGINNWTVNIRGGGVLDVQYNNKNLENIEICIQLYFSEAIPSKSAATGKQPQITGRTRT